jgi:hypothetical protein
MFRLVSAVLMLLFLLPPHAGREKEKRPDESVLRGQGVLKCEDASVVYSPFDETYAKRILLKDVSDSEDPPQNAAKEYSPERDMWMVMVEPDTSKPGPWNTTVYFGSNANEKVWKLTLLDVRNVGVKWLNEKLAFGQIWWGRTYETEFILDLQQDKFIYREMAQYGAKSEPCQ